MDSSTKSDKISDIVKLKRMLKKWRNHANSSSSNDNTTDNNSVAKKGPISRTNSSEKNEGKKKGSLSRSNSMKGISFLKRTLSFTDLSTQGVSSNAVPKGFLAVHVGEEMKRFVIPTNYLKHPAFCLLLKEAEDEFGFQQEGVLRIPCEVDVFEDILSGVEVKSNGPEAKKALKFSRNDGIVCGSTESQSLSTPHHPSSPMCR
ncbi:hypothetical protein RND81_10G176800 [Saponaria officinalis]|uniref:Uncharacterized protein n=1 Tax=Saponaria officinalis TaxID=3572 RepID=A0AAW1I5S0_SAPOF